MTAITETIEALERAVGLLLSINPASRISQPHDTIDAARLDALAKALADLSSDEWWTELANNQWLKAGWRSLSLRITALTASANDWRTLPVADKMTKAERCLIDAVMARYVEWLARCTPENLKIALNPRTNTASPLAAKMLKAAMAVEKERKRG